MTSAKRTRALRSVKPIGTQTPQTQPGAPVPPILPPDRAVVQMVVFQDAIGLDINGGLNIAISNDPAKASQPFVLVNDEGAGAWRAIVLPPGTHWRLQAATAPAPPKVLWRPGMPT